MRYNNVRHFPQDGWVGDNASTQAHQKSTSHVKLFSRAFVLTHLTNPEKNKEQLAVYVFQNLVEIIKKVTQTT